MNLEQLLAHFLHLDSLEASESSAYANRPDNQTLRNSALLLALQVHRLATPDPLCATPQQ
ncbi:hypothetical protein D3C76_857560 [compost metagenome]